MIGDYAVVTWPLNTVKMKLMLVATVVVETVIAIDAVIDGNYAVLKAFGQHGVMHSGKRKSKGYKGTNMNIAFFVPVTIQLPLITIVMRVPRHHFGWTLAPLLRRTFAPLRGLSKLTSVWPNKS